MFCVVLCVFLLRRRPPRSTRTTHSFPTRRSSDLWTPEGNAMKLKMKTLPVLIAGSVALLAASVGAIYAYAASRSSSARSEEHTSELQSLMRISYALFCLKINNTQNKQTFTHSCNNDISLTYQEQQLTCNPH